MLFRSVVIMAVGAAFSVAAAADQCTTPANRIVAENCLPGTPRTSWDVPGARTADIDGFATELSIPAGGRVRFKIRAPSSSYRVRIFRLGFYGGAGARLLADLRPTTQVTQPACASVDVSIPDTSGNPSLPVPIIDCGNWTQTAQWDVPVNAVSGVYVARLEMDDGSVGAHHIVFIVTEDRTSDLLVQASDTTWTAYNPYGGYGCYDEDGPLGRGYKVSTNRPLHTRSAHSYSAPFDAEYPTIRWLERNGYDVTYASGLDVHRNAAMVVQHGAYLSMGHDEYWTGPQRTHVEDALLAGVHLLFLGANDIFWRIRFEPSLDGTAPDRTMVCFKESMYGRRVDPLGWTGTFRDGRFVPAQPENALQGTMIGVADLGFWDAMHVSPVEGKLRAWRHSGLELMGPTEDAQLTWGTLSYEWDVEPDNGARPPGLFHLSSRDVFNVQRLINGSDETATTNATHHMTLYRHASGALVFSAGATRFAWGLDATHDNPGSLPDVRMQQMLMNVLSDMGLAPATPDVNLVPDTGTIDVTPPVATILPVTRAVAGEPAVLRGSSTDSAGTVAAVEVSVDGGASWHPAQGAASWQFPWTPERPGTARIRVRAVDDSGNLQAVPAALDVEVAAPCPRWTNANPADTFTFPSSSGIFRVAVPRASTLDVAGPITVEAWLRVRALGTWQDIVERGAELPGGYALHITPEGNLQFCINAGTAACVMSASRVEIMRWYHVAGSLDGQRMIVTLDGSVDGVAPSSAAPASSSEPILVGGARFPLRADLDDLRISRTFRGLLPSTPARHPGLAPDVVGLWDFSGGAMEDRTCGAHDGVLATQAPPPPPPAQPVRSLLLEQGAYVAVPSSASVDLTGPVTVEAWVKPTTSGAQAGIIERCGFYPNSDGGWFLRMLEDGRILFATARNHFEWDGIVGQTVLQPGRWYHVAGVFDGAELRVFVDGLLEGRKPVAVIPVRGTAYLVVGATLDGVDVWGGLLDGVRISAAALYDELFTPELNPAVLSSTRALWRFDGNLVDELHGTPAPLTAGTIQFSTDVPGGTAPPPPSEWSLSLLQASGYLAVPPAGALDVGSAFTVEAWVKPRLFGTQMGIAERCGWFPNDDGGWLFRVLADGRAMFAIARNNGVLDEVRSTAPLVAGRWQHLAGSFDGAQLRIFVNGALAGQHAAAIVPAPQRQYVILGATLDGVDHFDGFLDEIRLSRAAITAPFTPAQRLAVDGSTLALWRFNSSMMDAAGNTVAPLVAGTVAFSSDVP